MYHHLINFMDEYINILRLSYSPDPEHQEHANEYRQILYTDPNALVYCTNILLDKDFPDIQIRSLIYSIIRTIVQINNYRHCISQEYHHYLIDKFCILAMDSEKHEKLLINSLFQIVKLNGYTELDGLIVQAFNLLQNIQTFAKGIHFVTNIIMYHDKKVSPSVLFQYNQLLIDLFDLEHLKSNDYFKIYKLVVKYSPSCLCQTFSGIIYENSAHLQIFSVLFKTFIQEPSLLMSESFSKLMELCSFQIQNIFGKLKSHRSNPSESSQILFQAYSTYIGGFVEMCIQALISLNRMQVSNCNIQGYLLYFIDESFEDVEWNLEYFQAMYQIALFHIQIPEDHYEELELNPRNFYFLTEAKSEADLHHLRSTSYSILCHLMERDPSAFIQELVNIPYSESIFNLVCLISNIEQEGINDILSQYAINSLNYSTNEEFTIISRDIMISKFCLKLDDVAINQLLNRVVTLLHIPQTEEEIPNASLYISYGCSIIYNLLSTNSSIPTELFQMLFETYIYSYNEDGRLSITLYFQNPDCQNIEYVHLHLKTLIETMINILVEYPDQRLDKVLFNTFDTCAQGYINNIITIPNCPICEEEIFELLNKFSPVSPNTEIIVTLLHIVSALLTKDPQNPQSFLQYIYEASKIPQFRLFRNDIFESIFDFMVIHPNKFLETGFAETFLNYFRGKELKDIAKVYLYQAYKSRLVLTGSLDQQIIMNELQEIGRYIDPNSDLLLKFAGFEMIASLCASGQIPDLDDTMVLLWCQFLENGGAPFPYFIALHNKALLQVKGKYQNYTQVIDPIIESLKNGKINDDIVRCWKDEDLFEEFAVPSYLQECA